MKRSEYNKRLAITVFDLILLIIFVFVSKHKDTVFFISLGFILVLMLILYLKTVLHYSKKIEPNLYLSGAFISFVGMIIVFVFNLIINITSYNNLSIVIIVNIVFLLLIVLILLTNAFNVSKVIENNKRIRKTTDIYLIIKNDLLDLKSYKHYIDFKNEIDLIIEEVGFIQIKKNGEFNDYVYQLERLVSILKLNLKQPNYDKKLINITLSEINHILTNL